MLPPLVEYAAARGVRLVIENCPMEGWHPDGYPANLAYSPELWHWLADLGLYLNFDPSHLVWLGIDPVAALTAHVDRVLHVQAKDAQVDAARATATASSARSIDKPSPWDSGWWRYRIPGLGEVDWRRWSTGLRGRLRRLRLGRARGPGLVRRPRPSQAGSGHRRAHARPHSLSH